MDVNKIAGIYKITNNINGKVYIGESENIPRRWVEHITALTYGEHKNYKLQNDFKEYGLKAFNFDIVEIIPIVDESSSVKLKMTLLCREHVYIKHYDSFEAGYNLEYTLNRIANKEKGMFNSNYDNADKIEKDYIMLKSFISENPNILNIEYQVNKDLTLTIKQIKKNNKKLEDKIERVKKNENNSEKFQKFETQIEDLLNNCVVLNVIYKDCKARGLINDCIGIQDFRSILKEHNILYTENNSWYATDESLNNKDIMIGKSKRNKYGFEYYKLYFTNKGRLHIEEILKLINKKKVGN